MKWKNWYIYNIKCINFLEETHFEKCLTVYRKAILSFLIYSEYQWSITVKHNTNISLLVLHISVQWTDLRNYFTKLYIYAISNIV